MWLMTALIIAVVLVVPVFGQSEVPLPPDLRITPVVPDVPPERAAFLGKWYGKWDGTLSTVLVVEEISLDPPRVVVVYAWGSSRSVPQPGWSRGRGRFSGTQLILDRFQNGAQLIYRMLSNGDLDGTYELGSYVGRATLKKMK
jgi:hypothetical protein